MELKKMADMYFDYCMSRQLRAKTIHAYRQTLRLFASWLDAKGMTGEVEDIRDATIRSFLLDLQRRGKYTVCTVKGTESINCPERREDYGEPLGNTTINNYLRNLKGFFSWLVEMEYIEKSPMRRVKLLPQQRSPKEYLEDAEVRALLSVMDKSSFPEYRDRVAVMIMLDSGTRLGETLALETGQVDVVGRAIHLPPEITKGRKARTVFISQRTAKELRRWIQFKEKNCDSPHLFPVKRTGQPVDIRHYEANFRKYLRRTTIDKTVSPHTLRNNFAKRCLLAGMDIYTLSRLLGHSSVTITEKAYLDVKDMELKNRYAQFSPMDRIY